VAVHVAERYAHLVGLAMLGAMAACGGTSKSTGPSQSVSKSCTPTGTVTLSALQAATIDCSNGGNGFTLAGSGATYLVVPEFAVGDVPSTSQPYTLGRLGAPRDVPSLLNRRPVVAMGPFGRPPFINYRQRTFDLRLLAAAHKRMSTTGLGLSATGLTRPTPGVSVRGAPPAIRSFHVIADSSGTTFKTSVARLSYTGTFVYVYVDTTAPKAPNGFSAGQLTQFGQYADQVLYPLVLNTFGPPTDIDANGHVIMLLTPIVNGLTPRSECATQGFVAGFFDSADLDSPSDPNSNAGEIFYQLVPDSAANFSCQHKASDIFRITPGTFLHELQHMINNGQHVLIHHGQPEDGWLDEGESIVATELGSRYYEAKFPPPTGRSQVGQLFPDSAEPFISEQLGDSYGYLTAPDTQSVTSHSDADGGLLWRAGDWLLLRYVGDQFDSTVYARLDESAQVGTANLAQATGVPFASMFASFGLALYTDSLPGVARSAIPAADRFVSRNLRQLYQRLYTECTSAGNCGSGGISGPFPITLQTLSPTSTLTGSMVPGAMSFYQLVTPSGSATVNIEFSPGTGAFPSSLHPQVAVFRLK
jgi:hypothetical protein